MKSTVHTVNRRRMVSYAVVLFLTCGAIASNAHASNDPSETVKFADLNLGSPQGVGALYARIHAAAGHVCEQPAGELAAVPGCMRKAEAEAVGKVNIPALTALYQEKTGTAPKTIIATR